MLVVGCGGHTPETQVAPLDQGEQQALSEVVDDLDGLLVMEMLRPLGKSPTREDQLKLSLQLRLARMRIDRISTHFEDHYDVALALGALYTTGISLGWPASAQLAEKFLQKAVAQDPTRARGWTLLGIVHLMTGDAPGAAYYLEEARDTRGSLSTTGTMAMAQAYHLSGRTAEAVEVLTLLVKRSPTNDFARVLRDIIQVAEEEQTAVFRIPQEFQPDAFRPENVKTALNFPAVEYRNTRHGFRVAYPHDWTLYAEEIAYPLGPCTHLAELTLDMPLLPDIPESTGDRIRVMAYPVGFGTSSAEFAEERLPIYRYPGNEEAMDPVINDSEQRYYSELVNRAEREGEMVFLVKGQMGFFFHLVTTPTTYEHRKEDFASFLEDFAVLSPESLVPPGCGFDAPASYTPPAGEPAPPLLY